MRFIEAHHHFSLIARGSIKYHAALIVRSRIVPFTSIMPTPDYLIPEQGIWPIKHSSNRFGSSERSRSPLTRPWKVRIEVRATDLVIQRGLSCARWSNPGV